MELWFRCAVRTQYKTNEWIGCGEKNLLSKWIFFQVNFINLPSDCICEHESNAYSGDNGIVYWHDRMNKQMVT